MRTRTLASLALLAGLGGGAASAHPAPEATPTHQEARVRLTTYLLFDGDCREAMTFYQTVLGGELTLTTVGESPIKGAFPPSLQGRMVSARLQSATVDLSASDWLRPGATPVHGNMVMLYLSGGTPDETRTLFARLAVGGQVTDPLLEQPFGLYGALNDRFGNRWMFHADPAAPGGE